MRRHGESASSLHLQESFDGGEMLRDRAALRGELHELAEWALLLLFLNDKTSVLKSFNSVRDRP